MHVITVINANKQINTQKMEIHKGNKTITNGHKHINKISQIYTKKKHSHIDWHT